MRDILAQKALNNIPRILGLIDRNKYSDTYGCFDRLYWNNKKSDFPSGMHQWGVLPLALVYKNKIPGNRWHGNERIKELCMAGLRYMDRCSHRDGSTDEFYPFERALGATAFTLYTGTEAYLILGAHDESVEDLFRRRADWLVKHSEPSVISNHQAGAALALTNVYKITGDKRYLNAARDKIRQVKAWSCDEGWFLEYEGCDPGYLTFTIDFLAKYVEKTGDKTLLQPLKKSVDFCTYFMHPDNSYAGEYGSRNTFHYLPHGFELLGKSHRPALQLNDRFMKGLAEGKAEYMEDDVYCYINTANYLQAFIDYNERRPPALEAKDFKIYFPKAKIYVQQNRDSYTVVSTAKGGVIKSYRDGKPVLNDTGLVARFSDGRIAAMNVIDEHKAAVDIKNSTIRIRGDLNIVKTSVMSPFKQAAFRIVSLTLGRTNIGGQLVKDLLIKRLITRKKKAPARFERTIKIGDKIAIKDKITLTGSADIETLTVSTNASFITVPSSRYYQESVLAPWTDLSSELDGLNENREASFEREI